MRVGASPAETPRSGRLDDFVAGVPQMRPYASNAGAIENETGTGIR